MDTILSGIDFAVTYLDDILLKSKNPEEHTKNVFEVFRRIQNNGFKLKEEKCDFLKIKSDIWDE